MELPHRLKPLIEANPDEPLLRKWSESQAARPQGIPTFLREEGVLESCEYAGLPEEIRDDVVRTARVVREELALLHLAWHCHWRMFHDPSFERREVREWTSLERLLGAESGSFCLLLITSGIPKGRVEYEARKIPRAVVVETLGDIEVWVDDHRRRRSRIGLRLVGLGWLLNHLYGSLYQLGRLQFAPGLFHGRLRVYRNRRDERVVALSERGVRFRPDGQVDGAGDIYTGATCVEADIVETDHYVEGIPIHPEGRAVLQPVRLPKSEWSQVLSSEDPALHIHIPEGRPLDFEECGHSIATALTFFPEHFPDRPFVVLSCGAWLLDAQFEQLLPPHANIVRFQKEFYLYPIRSSGQSTFDRVFGSGGVDPASAPRDTTLRRVILEHLERGGHFRGGGCFLFPQDLAWGSQVYRHQSHPFTKITA